MRRLARCCTVKKGRAQLNRSWGFQIQADLAFGAESHWCTGEAVAPVQNKGRSLGLHMGPSIRHHWRENPEPPSSGLVHSGTGGSQTPEEAQGHR